MSICESCARYPLRDDVTNSFSDMVELICQIVRACHEQEGVE